MEVLKISTKKYKNILKRTAGAIKAGKVIVCPTDTVYGLICDARNAKAASQLFLIKQRPQGKAIPIFVRDLSMAKRIAQISKIHEKFLRKFWPGKVTVVFKKRGRTGIARILFSKEKTTGLRIPKYKIISDLLARIPVLTGTSANISRKPDLVRIKEVLRQFRKKRIRPDLVLDAGNLKRSLPSTVVDFSSGMPSILRRGSIAVKVEKEIKKYKNFFLK